MTIPLVFLAVLSVVAGWVGIPWLSHNYATAIVTFNGHAHHVEPNIPLMLISTVVALSGIGLAYLMYYKGTISPEAMGQRFKPIYTLLYNKYYIDEIYDAVIIRPTYRLADFLWSFDARVVDGLVNLHGSVTVGLSTVKLWFDTYIIDGTANGLGIIVGAASSVFRLMQSGRLAHYLLAIFFGMLVLILITTSNLLNWAFVLIGLR
jgi:NADH-quinone oxidoreductase subunit L